MAIINDGVLNKKVQRVIDDQKRAALKQALERGQREIERRARASAYVRADGRIIVRAGENSVVDNRQLPRMPQGSCIIIPDEIYQSLRVVADVTNEKTMEVPFYLTGYNSGQTVYIDGFNADTSANQNNVSATFSEQLTQEMFDFAKAAKPGENKALVHGHTHPRIGHAERGYLNYSIGDIDAYIKMHYDFPEINGKINVLGCLLTGGNFNFVFFDGNDMYRFDDVFVKNSQGELKKLPAFGPDIIALKYAQHRGLQNS